MQLLKSFFKDDVGGLPYSLSESVIHKIEQLKLALSTCRKPSSAKTYFALKALRILGFGQNASLLCLNSEIPLPMCSKVGTATPDICLAGKDVFLMIVYIVAMLDSLWRTPRCRCHCCLSLQQFYPAFFGATADWNPWRYLGLL